MFDNGISEAYFKGYTGEESTNKIPPITPETIVGLGIFKGISGCGIEVQGDGGFLKNYFTMGLIVGGINYLLIFGFLRKGYKKSKFILYRCLIIFLFVYLIIGEVKEYFVYQYYYMCFMFLILYLIEKEEKFNNVSIARN